MRYLDFIRKQKEYVPPADIPQKGHIDQLFETRTLTRDALRYLLESEDERTAEYLFFKARIRQKETFENKIYLRGLIEFSNFCRCDCKYCGIRKSNGNVQRYHMSREDILRCAELGHMHGFRTFVLQGGEDLSYSDDDICRIVSSIREKFPDSAVTLSIGERTKESYQKYFDAGAERYLLRHEAAAPELYRKLHPQAQTLENRIRCLYDLKSIGYQVGAGMMLHAPGQTLDDLITDFFFLQKLQPDMIGCGPFIPHKDTEYRNEEAGSVELTLRVLGILRLMFPEVLLPSTTALGTIDPMGREKGILAGANVVMPNLSPRDVRKKYMLYDNKICTEDDAVQCAGCMNQRMKAIGYRVVEERGDAPRKVAQMCRQKSEKRIDGA